MQTEDIKKLKISPYNRCAGSARFRACVGNNSGVNVNSRDCSIIDGYKETVDILMQHIKDRSATVDTVVYPFLFSCRHSIELSLKVLIKNFLIIYKRKHNIQTGNTQIQDIEKILKQHDISKLVECFLNFSSMDIEIKKIQNEFRPVIDSLEDYYFDPYGDVFRYTYKRNLKDINLNDIGLIDLSIFYEKYQIISKTFDYLINEFCLNLHELYYKSFTQNLNRQQIEEISKRLPNYNEWKNCNFKIIKTTFCDEYQISSSELEKAIEIIKNHYMFCNNIGLEKKFKNISETTFEILKKFLLEHKNTGWNQYAPFNDSFLCDGKRVFNSLPKEDLCTLITFYEYGLSYINGNYMCEDLDLLYEDICSNLYENDEYLFNICGCILNGKLKRAFEDCGQLTYNALFDKYLAETIEFYQQ